MKRYKKDVLDRIKGRRDIKKRLISGLWFMPNTIYILIRENKWDGHLTTDIISQVIAEMLDMNREDMFEYSNHKEMAEAQ